MRGVNHLSHIGHQYGPKLIANWRLIWGVRLRKESLQTGTRAWRRERTRRATGESSESVLTRFSLALFPTISKPAVKWVSKPSVKWDNLVCFFKWLCITSACVEFSLTNLKTHLIIWISKPHQVNGKRETKGRVYEDWLCSCLETGATWGIINWCLAGSGLREMVSG